MPHHEQRLAFAWWWNWIIGKLLRAWRHLSVLKDTPTKHSYKSASNPPVQPLSTLIPAKKTFPLTFGFDFAACKINGFITVIIWSGGLFHYKILWRANKISLELFPFPYIHKVFINKFDWKKKRASAWSNCVSKPENNGVTPVAGRARCCCPMTGTLALVLSPLFLQPSPSMVSSSAPGRLPRCIVLLLRAHLENKAMTSSKS